VWRLTWWTTLLPCFSCHSPLLRDSRKHPVCGWPADQLSGPQGKSAGREEGGADHQTHHAEVVVRLRRQLRHPGAPRTRAKPWPAPRICSRRRLSARRRSARAGVWRGARRRRRRRGRRRRRRRRRAKSTGTGKQQQQHSTTASAAGTSTSRCRSGSRSRTGRRAEERSAGGSVAGRWRRLRGQAGRRAAGARVVAAKAGSTLARTWSLPILVGSWSNSGSARARARAPARPRAVLRRARPPLRPGWPRPTRRGRVSSWRRCAELGSGDPGWPYRHFLWADRRATTQPGALAHAPS